MRLVHNEVLVRGAAWVVVDDITHLHLPTHVSTGHRCSLSCGMESRLEMPLNELLGRLTRPAKAILVEGPAEVVHSGTRAPANGPSPILDALTDEPIVLRLVSVAEQPVLEAGEYHATRPTR
jgi:hypothetical protein